MSLLALLHVAVLSMSAAPAPVAAPAVADADVATTCATLPGAPRDVRVTRSEDGIALTWMAPASSGCTELSGFVVIPANGDAFTVDASAREVTLPASRGLRVSVAAMNAEGSSVRTQAVAGKTVVIARK